MKAFIKISIIVTISSLLIGDESYNTELIAHIPYEEGVNDCWGYTTPDGREFAIVGTNSGTSIVEVVADSIIETGFITGGESIWRDMKSWGNYIYSGTENNSGGIQVISMEDPDNPELVYTWDGALSSHNIMISNGYLYVIGASDVAYLIILSLEDPVHPEQVGIWNEEYLHDVCFDGNILYGCGIFSNTMFAIDVTDKHNPQTINYWSGIPSAHACWPTEDGNFLLTASETGTGHIMIWDVEDIYNVNLVSEWVPEGAEWESSHNVFVRDNYAYMSYYKFGLQIIDISNPYEPIMAGYYDTYPDDVGGLFNGAWGTYPFQPSCNIYISDRQSGLFVVSFDGCTGADPLDPVPPDNVTAFSDYLTPESIELNWENPETLHDGTPLNSFSVNLSRNETFITEIVDGSETYIDLDLEDGIYYTYQVTTIDLMTDSTSNFVEISAYSGGSPFPSEPSNFTANPLPDGIELSWVNPNTQSDGTFLDDLSHSRIYRNGTVITELAANPGDETVFVDLPPEGFIYTYFITAIDNETPPHESDPTESLEVFSGDFPEYLIWEPSDNTPLSGEAILNDLEALNIVGYLTNDLWVFGNPIEQNFSGIFILNGIWPNNHQLTLTEQNIIVEYILSGGNVYLEDGDIWSQFEFNDLIFLFNCIGLSDGSGDLESVEGLSGVFTENMIFDYSGENNWIDRLQSLSSAFPILVSSSPEYITAVAFDNEYYRTIGTSFEYGGLPDSDQRTEFLSTVLIFFENGGQPNWLAGDVNQDENVDILDIIIVVDFILEIVTPSPVESWVSDLNHDSILDILDIMLFIQIILDE